MDRDGSNQRRIGEPATWITDVAISPSGARVAYRNSWWVDTRPFQDIDSGESDSEIRLAQTDGTGESVIWEAPPPLVPIRFHPDDRTLEVWTSAPFPASPPQAGDIELTPATVTPERLLRLSPDGKWLLDVEHSRQSWEQPWELWMIAREGDERRLLTSECCRIREFSFSPDGSQVVHFVETGNIGLGEIRVVDVNGADRRKVGSSRNTGVLHAIGRVPAFLISIPATLVALILWGI